MILGICFCFRTDMEHSGKWIVGAAGHVATTTTRTVCQLLGGEGFVEKLHLGDEWRSTAIKRGDKLNAWIDDEVINKTLTLSRRSRSVLVVHPEVMVTVTEVAAAVECARKGALSAVFKTTAEDLTYAQYRGKVVHDCLHLMLDDARPPGTTWKGMVREALEKNSEHVADADLQTFVQECRKDLKDLSGNMKSVCRR